MSINRGSDSETQSLGGTTSTIEDGSNWDAGRRRSDEPHSMTLRNFARGKESCCMRWCARLRRQVAPTGHRPPQNLASHLKREFHFMCHTGVTGGFSESSETLWVAPPDAGGGGQCRCRSLQLRSTIWRIRFLTVSNFHEHAHSVVKHAA